MVINKSSQCLDSRVYVLDIRVIVTRITSAGNDRQRRESKFISINKHTQVVNIFVEKKI